MSQSLRLTHVAVAVLPVAAMLSASWSATPARAADCGTTVASDFNGDGAADLAVGEPGRDGGVLRILYGTGTGLGVAGNQYFGRGTPGMDDILGKHDVYGEHSLGSAIATGYFDDDCYADLAVGGPGTNRVLILYGSTDGISVSRGTRVTQADLGIAGAASGFGTALSAGDVNGDGLDDLAVGQPSTVGGGAVALLYGSARGLTTTGSQVFTQDTQGISGGGEAGDRLGASVVLADFTGDGHADLAAGLPGESTIPPVSGRPAGNGAVLVVPGSARGLTASGSKLWTQNTPGVPGGNEADDAFGTSLAAADLDRDGRADLAIGVPGETVHHRAAAGDVTILRGAPAGLTATRAQAFSQNSTSIPGKADAGDRFGEALAFGDFNGDRYADLVASAPGEDIGGVDGAGEVIVIYGKRKALTGVGATWLAQSAPDVPGDDESGDHWGARVGRLASPAGTADRLVVGAPGEGVGSIRDAGSITVFKDGASGSGAVMIDATGLVAGAVRRGAFGSSVA